MPRFPKAVMEPVDRGHKPRRHSVQVAAFTGSQVHGRGQCIGRLFRRKPRPGKIERRIGGILHPIRGVRSRFFHGFIQKLRLLLRIAHRLVGELHGLVHVGKALHAHRANGGQWERHMRRQALPQPFHFPADVLQLLPGSSDLLQRHGRLFGLFFQGFQLLLGLHDLPLQAVILLLRDRPVLQGLLRLL